MPKADGGSAATLLSALGVDWDSGTSAWNLDQPHPSFKGEWPPYLGTAWPEYYGPLEKALVFVRDGEGDAGFNSDSPISAGLKELLFFYPGAVRPSATAGKYKFIPLVSLGTSSGLTPWDQLTMTPKSQTRFIDPRTGQISVDEEPARSDITTDLLRVLNPEPQSYIDPQQHVVAAHIKGDDANPMNVVFICDLDFASDLANLQEEAIGQKIDNLSLLQNSIEVLAGTEGFVKLRNRRAVPRTLTRLESIFKEFRSQRLEQQQVAEKKVKDEMAEAQKMLDAAAEEIEGNESLSFFEKLQKTSRRASDVQRRFDLRKSKLDKELKAKITKLEVNEQQQIQATKNKFRFWTIFAAPLPALMLGIAVLWTRMFNEQRQVKPERRVSS